VQEQPSGGVHPRHICLELDPESQAILSAGMGPRSRASPSPARTLAAADRLRKRLRSKGIRASYNLQMVGGARRPTKRGGRLWRSWLSGPGTVHLTPPCI
jgi:hypothetical protein